MPPALEDGHRETAAPSESNNQKVKEQLKELGCLAHRREDLGGHHGCLQMAGEVPNIRGISLIQYGHRIKAVPMMDSSRAQISPKYKQERLKVRAEPSGDG